MLICNYIFPVLGIIAKKTINFSSLEIEEKVVREIWDGGVTAPREMYVGCSLSEGSKFIPW